MSIGASAIWQSVSYRGRIVVSVIDSAAAVATEAHLRTATEDQSQRAKICTH